MYSASGAKAGPGAEQSWTELKDGRQRLRGVCSDSKEKRMRLQQYNAQGLRGQQEQSGKR